MKFAHPGSRHSGVVVALSALRSESSPACGEFPDLVLLGDLARSWNFDLIQLLPVNDTGGMSSPYTALSAFALHPLYLRLSDLPEARSRPEFALKARALADSHAADSRFSYGPYRIAKLALLEELFVASRGRREDEAWLKAVEGFPDWLAENAWVRGYAVFSELKRRAGDKPWWLWETDRDPGAERVDELWKSADLAGGTRFFAWLQFRADAQFRAAAGLLAGRGVDILGDIPILIGKDSADVWAEPSIFGLGLSAGSPPDGENPLGQNWGFPVYDWDVLERRDLDFWRDRLRVAGRYYSAYRIDHVLGFFRIWTVGERERSGYLGRFLPSVPIDGAELGRLGFNADRIRWLSRPHLPLRRLSEAAGGDASALAPALERLLERIGGEDLFLFKASVKGELDIEEALSGSPRALCDLIVASWRDRALLEFEEGLFVPTWNWRGTTSWASLSDDERSGLELLFAAKKKAADAAWEKTGRRILGTLARSSEMLATAEDLGAIPPFVPRVLDEFGILGLRVLRWTRRWDEPGQPLFPSAEWPSSSVACPSVHDSSVLREWWEAEADRALVWDWAARSLGRWIGDVPTRLGPGAARILLEALAGVASGIAVYPI